MNMQDVQPTRPYSSRLREEQAGMTRDRILAAFAEQLVDSQLSDFSIERVAKRAGVSIRTVYHHFPNREAIHEALWHWVDRFMARDGMHLPERLEELGPAIRDVFREFDDNESFWRAQLLTATGRNARTFDRERRREHLVSLVRGAAPELDETTQQQATAVLHYLASSEAWRSMKDEWGMSGAAAGEAVAWVMDVLVRELRQTGKRQGKGGKK